MVRRGIKLKSFILGKKKKKKKINFTDWWIEDKWTELDDIEHGYFINKELRRVK